MTSNEISIVPTSFNAVDSNIVEIGTGKLRDSLGLERGSGAHFSLFSAYIALGNM